MNCVIEVPFLFGNQFTSYVHQRLISTLSFQNCWIPQTCLGVHASGHQIDETHVILFHCCKVSKFQHGHGIAEGLERLTQGVHAHRSILYLKFWWTVK